MASVLSLESIKALEPNALIFFTIIIASAIVAVSMAAGTLFAKKQNSTAMDPEEFHPFKLFKKECVSHDTRRFTFSLQTPTTKLGLPIGQHISLRFTDVDGKKHMRSYTPVTGDETPGTVTFVIKVYKSGVHPKFPEGGKMSQHLDSLNIGDTIEMRGPKGHMEYFGKGKFSVKPLGKPLEIRNATHFGMIAGGTGITPMLQILHAIFRDPKDTKTTVSLLYANQTEDDILVREELETLQKEFPDRFKLHYTLDRPPTLWNYSQGFVNKSMVENHVLLGCDNSKSTTQVLLCGPPPMIKFACIPALEELGLKENQWSAF